MSAWRAWAAAAVAVFVGITLYRLSGQTLPLVLNDGYQYLAVAEQALQGRLGYTSLVHFEAERSFGVLPAPLVTFPMGFPLALAAGHVLTGLSLPQVGLALNVACAAGVLLLLAWAAKRLHMPAWATVLLLGLQALNSQGHVYATALFTESLCTFLLVASLLTLTLPDQDGAPPPLWRALLAGLLLGLAYHVRYAALFALVGVCACVPLTWLMHRKALAKRFLVAAVSACAVMAVGLLRNISLVGHWRGGNEKQVFHPVASVLSQTVGAMDTLVLGPAGGPVSLGLHAVFWALLVGGCLWWRTNGAKREQHLAAPVWRDQAAWAWVLVVGVYGACMFYAGVTTVISYAARMFVPVLPLVFLSAVYGLCRTVKAKGESWWFGGAGSVRARGALSVCVALYVGLNAWQLSPLDLSRNVARRAMLFEDRDHGRTAHEAVNALLKPGQAILASSGQSIGQLLGVPTVSMVSTEYAKLPWDDALMRDVVKRFQVAAVVVRRPAASEASNPDVVPTEAVARLTRLEHPSWLQPVWVSPRLVVYRVLPR